MVDTAYWFPNLEILETLRFLADFADKHPEQVSLIEQLSLRADEGLLKPTVTLQITDPFATNNAGLQAAFDAFQTYFKAEFPSHDVLTSNVDKSFNNFGAGVANLLANAPQSREDAIEAAASEQLLVAPMLSMEEIQRIYRGYQQHATSVRVATLKTRDRSTKEQGQMVLFHVKDDKQRHSTFQGLLQGSSLPALTVLNTYRVTPPRADAAYAIFLPFQTSEDALRDFSRILLAAPAAFGGSAKGRRSTSLAAITQGDTPRVLYLAHLAFVDEVDVDAEVAAFEPYAVFDLANSQQALEALRKRIKVEDPNSGYRLKLLDSHYNRFSNREREKLRLELAQRQERLAQLESFSVSRPRLLRFHREQLPALAEIIRRYDQDSLAKLSYGYQAHREQHQEGWHFLYIQPSVGDLPLSVLANADRDVQQPIAFWLDPTWARFYHQASTRLLVFVPQGKMLAPSMHSWSPEEMDNYLRTLIGKQTNIPKNAAFLFDPYDGQNIRIAIIDLDGFKPLNDPTIIGWYNDNLLTLRELPQTSDFIKLMSTWVRKRDEGQALQIAAEQSMKDYEQTAQQVGTEMVALTRELMELLDSEFQKVIDDALSFSQRVQQMNTRLEKLKQLHSTLEAQSDQIDKMVTDVRSNTSRMQIDFQTMKTNVLSQLEKAQQQQEELKQKTEEYIQSIRGGNNSIENQLNQGE